MKVKEYLENTSNDWCKCFNLGGYVGFIIYGKDEPTKQMLKSIMSCSDYIKIIPRSKALPKYDLPCFFIATKVVCYE